MRVLRKIYNKLRKIHYKLLSTNKNVVGIYKICQPTCFCGGGKIILNKTQLGWQPSPYYYDGYIYLEARFSDSEINIGESLINNNLTVISEHGIIKVGNYCMIGTNVEIINSDFHSIKPYERNSGKHKSKNIIIGDNVWIGSNVKIMKGVHIGDGAIISNGSIVYDNVEENTIVRGNPAIFYKKINL